MNGKVRQSSNNKHIIFDVFEQVEHLSAAMTLEPGDLLFTDTPGGVGAAMKPMKFLQPSEAGGDALTVQADVASDEDYRRLANALPGDRLDVLVNNAGTTKTVPAEDLDGLTDEDFRHIYDVNVVGAYRGVRAARAKLDRAREASGVPVAILNVSSIAGIEGRGSSVAYAASKAALDGMTVSLARALAPRIRVNAICPSFVDSEWWPEDKHGGAGQREAIRGAVAATVPLQAASTPADIADAGLAFCLPGFGHVTGETLLLDAGMHLKMGPEDWGPR